jgi:hypothetical protein
MSKASEHAELVSEVPIFSIRIVDGTYTDQVEVARVTPTGFLRLQDDEISPAKALELAAWLNDTFQDTISTWSRIKQIKFHFAAIIKLITR